MTASEDSGEMWDSEGPTAPDLSWRRTDIPAVVAAVGSVGAVAGLSNGGRFVEAAIIASALMLSIGIYAHFQRPRQRPLALLLMGSTSSWGWILTKLLLD